MSGPWKAPAGLVVLLALALLAWTSCAGCGPRTKPTGPRARPDLHRPNCVAWCAGVGPYAAHEERR